MKQMLLLLALLCVSCGGSDSAPSSINLSGTWAGTATSTLSTSLAAVRATIQQNGLSLTGTWSLTAPDGSNAGTVSGSQSGSSASLTLTPSDPRTCSYAVTANVTSSRLTGTYAAVSCSVASSGSLDLTKQ